MRSDFDQKSRKTSKRDFHLDILYVKRKTENSFPPLLFSKVSVFLSFVIILINPLSQTMGSLWLVPWARVELKANLNTIFKISNWKIIVTYIRRISNTYFFMKKYNAEEKKKNTYSFKSYQHPPLCNLSKESMKDIFHLVKSIRFRTAETAVKRPKEKI